MSSTSFESVLAIKTSWSISKPENFCCLRLLTPPHVLVCCSDHAASEMQTPTLTKAHFNTLVKGLLSTSGC